MNVQKLLLAMMIGLSSAAAHAVTLGTPSEGAIPADQNHTEQDIKPGTGVGVLYFNDGSQTKNDNDGMALMGWYGAELTRNLTVKAGAGAYMSTNTESDGTPIPLTEKKFGAVAAFAVLYQIFGSNFYIRAQYARAAAPTNIDTDTVFVGIGYRYESDSNRIIQKNLDYSVYGGNSRSTQDDSRTTHAFQIEVRKIKGDVGYSVSLIHEGNNGVTDRNGVAGQIWYVTPTADGWGLTIGAGPYLTLDDVNNKTQLMALASIEARKQITKTVSVAVRLNRVISADGKDQNMILIGVQKKF